MGIYSEYIGKQMSWNSITNERKKQLKRIRHLRGERNIFVIAAAIGKPHPIGIDFNDRVPVFDQINNLNGTKIDIILETPGGSAEVVEDIVRHLRKKFEELTIIIPGCAKSAGTIFTMAADEILMEPNSTLGPIDAQIMQNGKRYSAHAYLEGLAKIKVEVEETKSLNKAYIPILQSITPGEIQQCENALSFSKTLVTNWLSEYKFKFWKTHTSTGKAVTSADKKKRAEEIAEQLCDHGKWLSHGRSITIDDLNSMKLKVIDYSENSDLCDAIRRYYILLKISFDNSSIYKIFETTETQVYLSAGTVPTPVPLLEKDKLVIDLLCHNCNNKFKLQANFKKDVPIETGMVPFPKNNQTLCPNCSSNIDLLPIRLDIEQKTQKQIL